MHRNWLAITYQLPLHQWYRESYSEWTLDYPPFFAYFEWLLSRVAPFFDVQMLDMHNLNYASAQTVYFQRLTVLLSEVLFVYALSRFGERCPAAHVRYTSSMAGKTPGSGAVAMALVSLPALLIVDHIHFQYNGFLFGILVVAILFVQQRKTRVLGAALFAVLLCFKHIFLYISTAFFVYLLRVHVFPQSLWKPHLRNLLHLGLVVVAVFGAAFAPFIWLGQLPDLGRRLFPFSRGLCHAYWAPNAWALYSFLDRGLILRKLVCFPLMIKLHQGCICL